MQTPGFFGFDHLDTRVKSLAVVERFYDLLMPALGLPRKRYIFIDGEDWNEVTSNDIYNALEYLEAKIPGKISSFMGVIEDIHMQPTMTRIAFRAADASILKQWERFLREIGAHKVELSEEMEIYPAVFFEDPAGTKLEICARLRG